MFAKIGATVPDLWPDTSFGYKWLKYSFYAPDPMVKEFLKISWFYWIHIMILEKMSSCWGKLETGFRTYGLISILGPRALRSKYFFMSSSIRFFMKKFRIFKFWVILTKLWVFIPRKLQKIHQKSSFWCHSIYIPSKSCLKKLIFLEH